MTITQRFRFALAALGIASTIALGACGTNRLGAPDVLDIKIDDVAEDAKAFKGTADDFVRLPESAYLRVDRMGMPAVSTALISSKDAYNAANPTDDAAGAFVPEIVDHVAALHAALDDDLTGLGLTPCATGDCVGQAAPFVVPDVIHIDTTQPAGFPNGRRLTDTVIDITLALALLDLNTHSVTTLIGVNPTANDESFKRNFPYLARPH